MYNHIVYVHEHFRVIYSIPAYCTYVRMYVRTCVRAYVCTYIRITYTHIVFIQAAGGSLFASVGTWVITATYIFIISQRHD